MLTREQVEEILHIDTIDRAVAVSLAAHKVKSLCDMALGYLAMQPRPLSEIDGGALVVALNEMDETAYHVLFKYPNGSWLSHGMGKPWPETTLAIPLSSLPKVNHD